MRDIAKYDPLTDTRTVVNHLVCDAFGNGTRTASRRREPAVDSLFLFTARPFDQDSQLQNNLHRWYDPAVGRWLSEDPVGFTAGDENLYRYVGNGVLTAVDPEGLRTVEFSGTVTIYPTPTGTFLMQIAVLPVIDPSQERVLGEHTVGYTLTYQAPEGVCQGNCEKIILTQAIHTPGLLTGSRPHFEPEDDPANDGLIFPEYTGQRPTGAGSLADAPFNPRTTLAVTHHVTVCAICNTTLYDRTYQWKIVIQQVLGCITFDWRDRNPPGLIKGNREYNTVGEFATLPAQTPGGPWDAALSNRTA